jgi:hypothetical protein
MVGEKLGVEQAEAADPHPRDEPRQRDASRIRLNMLSPKKAAPSLTP